MALEGCPGWGDGILCQPNRFAPVAANGVALLGELCCLELTSLLSICPPPKKFQEKFQGGVGTGGGSLQDRDCLRVPLKKSLLCTVMCTFPNLVCFNLHFG